MNMAPSPRELQRFDSGFKPISSLSRQESEVAPVYYGQQPLGAGTGGAPGGISGAVGNPAGLLLSRGNAGYGFGAATSGQPQNSVQATTQRAFEAALAEAQHPPGVLRLTPPPELPAGMGHPAGMMPSVPPPFGVPTRHLMHHGGKPELLLEALPSQLFEIMREVVFATRDTTRRFWVSAVEPRERRLRTPVTFIEQVVQRLLATAIMPMETLDLFGCEFTLRTETAAETPIGITHERDETLEARGILGAPAATILYYGNSAGLPHLVLNQSIFDPQAGPTEGWIVQPEENSALVFPGDWRYGVIPPKSANTYLGTNIVPDTDKAQILLTINVWTVPGTTERQRQVRDYGGDPYESHLWFTPPDFRRGEMVHIGREIVDYVTQHVGLLRPVPLPRDPVAIARAQFVSEEHERRRLENTETAHRAKEALERWSEYERRLKNQQGLQAKQQLALMAPPHVQLQMQLQQYPLGQRTFMQGMMQSEAAQRAMDGERSTPNGLPPSVAVGHLRIVPSYHYPHAY